MFIWDARATGGGPISTREFLTENGELSAKRPYCFCFFLKTEALLCSRCHFPSSLFPPFSVILSSQLGIGQAGFCFVSLLFGRERMREPQDTALFAASPLRRCPKLGQAKARSLELSPAALVHGRE